MESRQIAAGIVSVVLLLVLFFVFYAKTDAYSGRVERNIDCASACRATGTDQYMDAGDEDCMGTVLKRNFDGIEKGCCCI